MATTSTSIYQAAMGLEFNHLAPEVQRFHTTLGMHTFNGVCTWRPGHGLMARVLGKALHWSGPDDVGVARAWRVDTVATAYGEQRTRRFARWSTRSLRTPGTGVVRERLGPFTLVYRLSVHRRGLRLDLERLSLLGIPCPGVLRPRLWATERGQDGRVCFEAGGGWGKREPLASCSGYLQIVRPAPVVANDPDIGNDPEDVKASAVATG